jgi:hypothetical protein
MQHERARNYQKGSGHDRKKQPDDAYKHENPAQSDALESSLGLGDSNLLHTGSPPLQLITSSCISIVLTFSREGGLSQREGIFRLKFNYTVHVKREASSRFNLNFALRVSHRRDLTKRVIGR